MKNQKDNGQTGINKITLLYNSYIVKYYLKVDCDNVKIHTVISLEEQTFLK